MKNKRLFKGRVRGVRGVKGGMQNAKLAFRFPLTLLRRLFFLAARHSANKFALCSRSAASVFRFPFTVFR